MTDLRFSAMWRFGACVCITLSLLVVNVIGVYLFAALQLPPTDLATAITLGSQDGIIVALSVIFTACVLSLMSWGLIYLKVRSGAKTHAFFSLGSFGFNALWRYVALMALIMFVSELLLFYFDSSPMSFLDALMTPNSFWWLIFAIVVAAPIYEEVVFRGLIFGVIRTNGAPTSQALTASDVSAMSISSLLFALVHLQYDLIGMMSIFLLGLLFCHARIKHGLGLAMVLHFLNNMVAMMVYLWSN